MTLECNRIDEWQPIVSDFYKEETEDFLNRYHKAGGGLIAAITSMIRTISPGAEFYLVMIDGERAAFFVKTKHESIFVMEGFHVLRKYRNVEFYALFWSRVRQVFGAPFFIGIFENNIPALKHLKKNGFEEVSESKEDGKRFIILMNKIF